jgi:hypothetical protein
MAASASQPLPPPPAAGSVGVAQSPSPSPPPLPSSSPANEWSGTLNGYTSLVTLFENRRSIVLRAVRDIPTTSTTNSSTNANSNNAVIIKMLNAEQPSSLQLWLFEQQYELTRSLIHLDGVVKVTNSSSAVLLLHFSCQSLYISVYRRYHWNDIEIHYLWYLKILVGSHCVNGYQQSHHLYNVFKWPSRYVSFTHSINLILPH